MKLQEKLLQYRDSKNAILGANFYNFETLAGIVNAAADKKAPVILQLSESSIRYLGLNVAATMAKSILKEYDVEGWLHLDHGSTIDIVRACLDQGFDSVMIDASEKSLEENIAITHQVVELAHLYGANVEAELGFIPKLGQEYNNEGLTDPEDALLFTKHTGVNALAVSIGSVHGLYKKTPHLDLGLLARINEIVPIPLVLHGSSGIPDSLLQSAIQNGICKVNLATETKNVFMKKLKEILINNEGVDPRKIFPEAIKAVQDLIISKLNIIQNVAR